MRKLLTRLLLIVALVSFGVSQATAFDMYLMGGGNTMDNATAVGFDDSKLPGINFHADGDTEDFYFWVKGDVKLSQNGSTNWNDWDNKALKIENGNIIWDPTSNRGDKWKIADDIRFIKFHIGPKGGNNVTISETPFAGHEGVFEVTDPTTGVYLYGGFDSDTEFTKIGCFKDTDSGQGNPITIPSADHARTFKYVVYSGVQRYGHPGGTFEQKFTNGTSTSYDYKNAVKLSSVSTDNNDYYYFTIPANVEVELSYQRDFNFNDNYNGFTDQGDRAVWVSKWTETAPSNPYPETGVYLYGSFNDGEYKQIGCFNETSDSNGTPVKISAVDYDRTFKYVVYSWRQRYGHPGGNFEQKFTDGNSTSHNDKRNAVELSSVSTSDNDFYYFTIPANVEVELTYENGLNFQQNYNGFSSTNGRAVYVSKWTDYNTPSISYPTTGVYLYGRFDDGTEYAQVGCFDENSDTNGTTVNIPASYKERTFYYVVYVNGKRYGHTGSNFQHKITDDSGKVYYDYHNAVKLEEVSSTDKDCYYFTIPANIQVQLTYYNNFGFNGDNINGFTSGNSRAAVISAWKEQVVQPPLYVYSNNSGDGSWTGDTGGREVTVNEPIVFTSNKSINFIFGPNSTYDKESVSDREQLYGAIYSEKPVESGSQRTAKFGKYTNFTIGSGQWEVTVTQFVPGESVTFSAIRKGDAPTDENSYIEYKIVDEAGTNLCTLQWDGVRNVYEGKLPASKGSKIRVWANKNNNSAESADYFGTPDGYNTPVQPGANRINLVKNGNPLQINCKNEHHILVAVENGRYTAPVRIAFEEEIFPDRAGKVYLLGQFLNDSYESPAWEMKKQGDGTYFLDEFAMRKNPSKSDAEDFEHMEIAVYDQYGRRTEKSVKREGFTVPRDYERQPGRLCTASLDAAMNTITLTEQQRGDAASSVMPYIGIIGKNFRQSTRYNTRHQYTKDGVETMGNTDLGWQEAYIEYGQFGSPLLDPNGNAYYNTVWPPRNNILMQAYFGEDTDPLNISSDGLTMRRDSRGIMTGSEWKTKLAELGYTPGTGSEPGKDNEGLCLVDNQNYARYVIENLWIAGEYKIWTGFGGKLTGHGADWNSFIYWGPGTKQQKNPNQTFIISGETENFFTKDNGREYYNTMEFFIPVNNDKNDYIFDFKAGNEPRLYITRAAGGAQLDAIARGNKLVGFAPKLNDLDGTGFHVTEYTVTRYAYDANTARDNWLPCDKNRTPVEKKDAVVVSQSEFDSPISTNESFNKLFAKNFPLKISDLTNYGGVYTDDKTVPNEDGSYREGYAPYAPGRYAFCMEIEFKNADGEKKNAKVWSPYVEIFEELGDVHIYEAQLVELPEGRDFLTNYKYVTYQPERTRFNRVAVQVDENGQPIELLRQEDNAIIEKLHEVYVKTGKWTNKVILLAEDPEGFIGTKKEFVMNEVPGSGAKTLIIDLQTPEAKKVRNWYAHIIDRGDVTAPATYEVYFKYTLTGGSGSGTEETVSEHNNTTVYRPWFMLPYIGEPEITVVSEGGENESFPASYTATHEHLSDADGRNQQAGVTSAHNELQVTVPVVMPNISEENGLRKAVYEALTVNVNGKESKPKADADGNYPAEFSLVYRHQNPYAWMTYGGSAWQPVTRSWNIGKSSYAETSAIRGIVTDETKKTVTTEVNPIFNMPDLASNDIFTAQVENAPAESGYKYCYVAKLKDLSSLSPAEDYIFGDVPLYSDNTNGDLTYLCRVRSNGTGIEGTAQKLYGKVITPATAGNHVLAEFYYNSDQPWGVDAQKQVTDWLRTLKIDFGRAYYFYSGENQQAGSGYVGLEGTLPDPADYTAPAPAETPKQRVTGVSESDEDPSYGGDSAGLAEGDNAYLLVPSYTMVNLGDENLDVAVDSVLGDTAGIESGKGYIDMLGNEGTIYAADGRKVYAGAARAELTPGVYMVTLKGRTFKVLVK